MALTHFEAQDLKKNNVKILVKSCDSSYSTESLEAAGIKSHELIFEDGQLPPKELQQKWLRIVDDFFDPKKVDEARTLEQGLAASVVAEESKAATADTASQSGAGTRSTKEVKESEKRIAVHCVAGLGRAPFLVALAIVYKGCKPQDAINLIRKNRRGALNPIQANYILEMKPGKGVPKNANGNKGCSCSIF